MEQSCLIVGDGNFSFAASLSKANHSSWKRCQCTCARADTSSGEDSFPGSGNTAALPTGHCHAVGRDSSPMAPSPSNSAAAVACSSVEESHPCTSAAAGPATTALTSDDVCAKAVRCTAPAVGGSVDCCHQCCRWNDERSLMQSLPAVWRDITSVVATCHETEEAVFRRQGASTHINTLQEQLDCNVFTSVDGTALQQHGSIARLRFNRIFFNFPHTGSKRDKIQENRRLLRDFFKSARQQLADPVRLCSCSASDATQRSGNPGQSEQCDGNSVDPQAPTLASCAETDFVKVPLDSLAEVQVPQVQPDSSAHRHLPRIAVLLLPGQGGTPVDGDDGRIRANHWQVVDMAASAGLLLCDVQRVDTRVLAGYTRTGLGSRDAAFGSGGHAVLHVFTPSPKPVSWGRLRFPNADNVTVTSVASLPADCLCAKGDLGWPPATSSGDVPASSSVQLSAQPPMADLAPRRNEVAGECVGGGGSGCSPTCTLSVCSHSTCHMTSATLCACTVTTPASSTLCPHSVSTAAAVAMPIRSLYPSRHEHHISFWLPGTAPRASDATTSTAVLSTASDSASTNSTVDSGGGDRSCQLPACCCLGNDGVVSKLSSSSPASINGEHDASSFAGHGIEECGLSSRHTPPRHCPKLVMLPGAVVAASQAAVSGQALRSWCSRFLSIVHAVCGETVRDLSLFDVYRSDVRGTSLTFSMHYQAVGLSVLSWGESCECQLRLRAVATDLLNVEMR